MSFLADPVDIDAPSPAFLESINDGLSHEGKILLCHSLSSETRTNYATAVKSYEYFCSTCINTAPYPATNRGLEEWTVSRLIGSTDPLLGRVKADTMLAYLSAIKSYHIDHGFKTRAFETPRLERLVKGARRYWPQTKAQRLPITKPILAAITSKDPSSIEHLNIDTAFKLAFAGFLRMGEYTYTAAQAKCKAFQSKQLTRSDVSFFPSHAVLRLKDSKTNVNHTGVEIVIARTDEPTCAYHALQELYRRDRKPATAPPDAGRCECCPLVNKKVRHILLECPNFDDLRNEERQLGFPTSIDYVLTDPTYAASAAKMMLKTGLLRQF